MVAGSGSGRLLAPMPHAAGRETLSFVIQPRYPELFRYVNDRIRTLGQPHASEYALVCECADGGCARPLRMRPDEYAAVRANPLRFAVVPGHERLGSAEVRLRTARYVVVELRERLH